MNNKNTGSDLSSCSRGLACGQRANLIAVTLANALAEGKSADQLEFLSSVLQLVGEALAVTAATISSCQDDNADIIN